MFKQYKFGDFFSWFWVVFVLWSLFGLLIFFRMGSWICLLPGFILGGFIGWRKFKEGPNRLLKTILVSVLSGFGVYGVLGACAFFQEIFSTGQF